LILYAVLQAFASVQCHPIQLRKEVTPLAIATQSEISKRLELLLFFCTLPFKSHSWNPMHLLSSFFTSSAWGYLAWLKFRFAASKLRDSKFYQFVFPFACCKSIADSS